MSGLMSYLAREDREGAREVHTNPHLVAGHSAVMAWHMDTVLEPKAALQIGWELDQPRRAFGTRVTTAVKDQEGHNVGVKDAHVWHCSLSLHPEEPKVSDEHWAAISEEFVARMGFSDPDSADAPCRWAAVHHGVSKGGNDHVHIVVGLVREDGTKATVWNDRPRAQQIAGELERKYGLRVVETREAGLTARGEKPAEREQAERRGAPETASAQLARTVRGCAASSADEAEFVRRLRWARLKVRPRYAASAGADGQAAVVGYSVALRAPKGSAPLWYGGGRLARDLTLPRLRADWPDTPEQAAAARAEWQSAKRNQAPVATDGRERRRPSPAAWARYTTEVTALREQLRSVPAGDRALWAHVARETSGAFAAWSARVEQTPGPLAETADILARSAQQRAHEVRPRRAGQPSARGAALLLSSIAHGGTGTVAEAALLRQLAKTVEALRDAHVAAGDAQRAAQVAAVLEDQLVTIGRAMATRDATQATPVADAQAVEAVRVARQGQLPLRTPGSPVAANLDRPQTRPRERPGVRLPDKSEAER